MYRRRFLSTLGAASAAAVTTSSRDAAHAAPPTGTAGAAPQQVDDRFLDALTAVNDLQVPATLASYRQQIEALAGARALAQSALRLISAHVNPRGRNHHSPTLLGPLNELLDALASRQNPSGLYDTGNLDSPPDTAFVISDLAVGYDLLRRDAEPATATARDTAAAIMRRSTPALAEGGVHTPNHRWELCKALAQLHHLWPSRKVRARIDDWLGEGIDQDPDGEYSERSPIYASEVTNRALVSVARLVGEPQLLDNVRRNLTMTLYRLEADGEVETVQSRRQDQTGTQDVWKYLMQFRELALVDGDRRFAAVAEQVTDRVVAAPAAFATGGYSVGEFLAEALAHPDLTAVLPRPVAPPTRYEKLFAGSQLVRIRRGDTTAGIFGGTDWHHGRVDAAGRPTTIREIASGLSTNPTFFKLRKGAAVLESVRLSPRFFSTGHFRSRGVTAYRGGWRLGDQVKVPYHLPLPRRHRRPDGAYQLGSEGRFYSWMAFALRPKQYRVLTTVVTIVQVGDSGFDLAFDVDGPATSLTVELCFRSGGSLSGVVPVGGDGTFQLVDGDGAYTVGTDTISFGPGNGAGIRQPIAMDPGERYTYLGGSLVPAGQRVYLTGTVPFRYTLRLR